LRLAGAFERETQYHKVQPKICAT